MGVTHDAVAGIELGFITNDCFRTLCCGGIKSKPIGCFFFCGDIENLSDTSFLFLGGNAAADDKLWG